MNEAMLRAAAKQFILDKVNFLRNQAEQAKKQSETCEEKWVNYNLNKATQFESIAQMLEDSLN